MAIRRFEPRYLDQSPLQLYSVLLLGQGYAANEFDAVCRDAFNRITSIYPLGHFRYGVMITSAAFYCDPGTTVDLRITQAGNQLSIAQADAGRLEAYLAGEQVRPDEGRSVPAGNVWPRYGRVGRTGSVVAVLVKPGAAATPAELDRVTPAPEARVPMVAVVVTGDYWHMPIVRAIGQTLGGLADEYENDGAEFDRVPPGAWVGPPNLVILTSAERSRLAGGEDPFRVIPQFPRTWPVNRSRPLTFVPHTSPDANPPLPQSWTGRVQLVEGGGGYRHNVLRCDFDCLMRRKPNSTQLPIQDRIQFCRACQQTLVFAILGAPGFDLSGSRRVLLDSQRLLYDEVPWTTPPAGRTRTLSGPSFTETIGPVGPDDPKWSCTVTVDATSGLTISNLKLANRPDDPFAAAEDVIERISFENLEVTFDGGAPAPLAIRDAFANRLAPPALEIATQTNTSNLFRAGIKLTLSWDLANGWAIEVVMSLVLRAKARDFDPGGAAEACKFYPQISLRHRRPLRGSPQRTNPLPRVDALRGAVVYVANNVIPMTLPNRSSLDPYLRDMAMGRITAGLFTDSNSSDDDSNYDIAYLETAARCLTPLPISVPIPLPTGAILEWNSGRKLAGVETCLAGGARFAHMNLGIPGLPHWSWLFDYGTPSVRQLRRCGMRPGRITRGRTRHGRRRPMRAIRTCWCCEACVRRRSYLAKTGSL